VIDNDIWEAFSGAPTSGTALIAAVTVGGTPPSGDSLRKAMVRRVDGTGLLDNGGSGLELQGGSPRYFL
jgi:hypothetical protein